MSPRSAQTTIPGLDVATLIRLACENCGQDWGCVPQLTIARACGLDVRTWRRWRDGGTRGGASEAIVIDVLDGWRILCATKGMRWSHGGALTRFDQRLVSQWADRPSLLTLACLTELHRATEGT